MKNEMRKSHGYKKIFLACFVSILFAGFLDAGLAHAKTERMAIQSPEQKAEQGLAKQNLKNVDLQKIEDPEARKAIQEILRYLRVQNKRGSR